MLENVFYETFLYILNLKKTNQVIKNFISKVYNLTRKLNINGFLLKRKLISALLNLSDMRFLL